MWGIKLTLLRIDQVSDPPCGNAVCVLVPLPFWTAYLKNGSFVLIYYQSNRAVLHLIHELI